MAIDFKAEKIADSPLNRPRTEQGIDFDYNTDRNAIGRSKIKNFNFSSGFGGTLVLGGTANGNGVMLVKDSSGNTIVTVDNAGVLIEGGNLIVKNEDNTTIIDTSGIVSTANFPNDQIFSSSGTTTTSTSKVDVPGSTLDSFVLDREANVLINFFAAGSNGNFNDDGSDMEVTLTDSVDGDLIAVDIYGIWAIFNIDFVEESWSHIIGTQVVTVAAIVPLSAGTHTIKLQFRTEGTGTSSLDAFLVNYIVLGT